MQGCLGGVNRQINENFEKVEFRTDYPWGEVVQRIARRAALRGTQVVVEVPPEAQVHQTKQYKTLSEDENWTSIKIDGCTHGQRLIVPGPSGIHTVGYCKVEWEYFAANVRIRSKSSDKCSAQHMHVCTQTMLDHADQGCRTSQVSRRLLNAVQFRAPSDGRLVSMPVNTPKGRIDRVIVSLGGMGDGFAEPDGTKGSARIHCQGPLSTCSQEDELIKKLKNACRSDLRTPVLFVASLLRSGERPKEDGGSCVGGDSLPGGKYKCFNVLKSPKRLLKKCAEFSNVYFSLDMPSSCSCWSWPELHALISSSKVRRAKVADHVDATGRLVGRRIVLSNMSDVECLGENFHPFAKRKTECSLFPLNSLGGHLQIAYAALFMLMQGPEEPFVTLRTIAWKGCRYQGTNYGALQEPQTLNN